MSTDFTAGKRYIYTSTSPYGHRNVHSANNTIAYAMDLFKERAEVLSMYENDMIFDPVDPEKREKYFRWDELRPGNTYSFRTNEYTSMQSQVFSVPFTFRDLYVYTKGYLHKDDENAYNMDALRLFNSISKSRIFYTEADKFSHITTSCAGTAENKIFYTYLNEKPPATYQMPNFSAA